MEGRAEGKDPEGRWRGFQGEEDWGSRRIKSFPLDPDTRQRQITRDLGVLGGSASSHTRRSFPTPGSSNESKGCCEEDAKIVCPSGTKGSGHHAREDAFSLPCSFREPVCALDWSTSWLQMKELILYRLFTRIHHLKKGSIFLNYVCLCHVINPQLLQDKCNSVCNTDAAREEKRGKKKRFCIFKCYIFTFLILIKE